MGDPMFPKREPESPITVYVAAVAGHYWTLLTGGAVAALYALASGVIGVPSILWVLFAAAAIFIAQFKAFNDVRKQRDSARSEIQTGFDSVKYRLVFDHSIIINRMARPDRPPGTKVGFTLTNTSKQDPIQFMVDSMAVSLDGRTDPHPVFDTSGAVLAPGQGYAFWFPWFDDFEIQRGMIGTLDYVIEYGHPELGPRFKLEHRQEFECVLNLDTDKWEAPVRDLLAPTVTNMTCDRKW